MKIIRLACCQHNLYNCEEIHQTGDCNILIFYLFSSQFFLCNVSTATFIRLITARFRHCGHCMQVTLLKWAILLRPPESPYSRPRLWGHTNGRYCVQCLLCCPLAVVSLIMKAVETLQKKVKSTEKRVKDISHLNW